MAKRIIKLVVNQQVYFWVSYNTRTPHGLLSSEWINVDFPYIYFGFLGSVTAYYDYYKQTIHHVNRSYTITEAFKYRCPAYQQFTDNYLRAWLSHMMSKQEKQVDPHAASSHVNFRYLSTPEKLVYEISITDYPCKR